MSMLDKVNPELVEAFGKALRTVAKCVCFGIVVAGWIVIIGYASAAFFLLGVLGLIAACVFANVFAIMTYERNSL